MVPIPSSMALVQIFSSRSHDVRTDNTKAPYKGTETTANKTSHVVRTNFKNWPYKTIPAERNGSMHWIDSEAKTITGNKEE